MTKKQLTRIGDQRDIRAKLVKDDGTVVNLIPTNPPDPRADKLAWALKAALEHENHRDGECGCCWTLKAQSALAAYREATE